MRMSPPIPTLPSPHPPVHKSIICSGTPVALLHCMNKNNRSDAEEAVANQSSGVFNQVKGKVKQAVGDLTDDRSMHASGTKDKLKGKLQKAYGDVKEKESELKRDLRGVDDEPI